MTLDTLIKDAIRDIEKLKEAGTNQDILDEIFGFTESLAIADVLALNPNQHSLEEPLAIADVLAITPQDSGTFLVGTARVGFADAG